MMRDDPIVEEVRAVRVAHAAQFNFDLQAIYRDFKRQEEASGRPFVSYPPRRLPTATINRPPGPETRAG